MILIGFLMSLNRNIIQRFFCFFAIFFFCIFCGDKNYEFNSIGYAITNDFQESYHNIQYKRILEDQTIELRENDLLWFYVQIDESLGLSKSKEYFITLRNRIGINKNIWEIRKNLTSSGELIFQIPSIIPGKYTLDIFYTDRSFTRIKVFFCNLDVFYSKE